jgi:Spy/CpxP family protein refolding chaperone
MAASMINRLSRDPSKSNKETDMRRFLILAAFIASASSAHAADMPAPPAGGHGFGGERRGDFMQSLTEEQKACIEKAGCQKPEMKHPGEEKPEARERGARPERPEMTEEEKAAMEANRECMKKAFADCGIQMPERPEGERPPV